MVADGPENPSNTLVLLAGDSAEISSYVADKPGRLEYAFDAYTISLPRGEDALLSEQGTLIGPGSVRLTAPTGVVNIAILKVNRASGRDPNKVQGSRHPVPPSLPRHPPLYPFRRPARLPVGAPLLYSSPPRGMILLINGKRTGLILSEPPLLVYPCKMPPVRMREITPLSFPTRREV